MIKMKLHTIYTEYKPQDVENLLFTILYQFLICRPLNCHRVTQNKLTNAYTASI